MTDIPKRSPEALEDDYGLVCETLARLSLAVRLRIRVTAGRRLSSNFSYREFYCKNGARPRRGRKKTYRALCRQYLEPMRARFGPCSVHSGYRTRSYNAGVGGERGSFHVNEDHDADDVAADVSFARGTASEWADYAVTLRRENRGGKGGVGRYPGRGFVHVDTRDYRADWSG